MKPQYLLIVAACCAAIAAVIAGSDRSWPVCLIAVALCLALVACSGII